MANNVGSALSSLLDNGRTFYAPLSDAGSGAVSLIASGAGASQAATFTRSTIATTIGSTGLIIPVSSGVARSYYDPTTLQYMGYLAEGARTNLVLNSKIDGTDFSTQSVTVTAVAHTLSFYGTGTITLTGASTSGPLVGTGVYPQRVTLTFTPSAGSLTLTVTGSCKYVQLEVGSFASTFIPTAGSSVTRNADVLTYPFAGNADATVGTAYAELSSQWNASVSVALAFASGRFVLDVEGTASTTTVANDGVNVAFKAGLTAMNTGVRKRASSWGSSLMVAGDGVAPDSVAFGGDFGSTKISVGNSDAGTENWFGTIKNVRIWQTQFTAAQLSAITSG